VEPLLEGDSKGVSPLFPPIHKEKRGEASSKVMSLQDSLLLFNIL